MGGNHGWEWIIISGRMIGCLKSSNFMIGFLETPSPSEADFLTQSLIGFEIISEIVRISTFSLRHLDADLMTVMKAGEDFDWQRISFVLEEAGFYVSMSFFDFLRIET